MDVESITKPPIEPPPVILTVPLNDPLPLNVPLLASIEPSRLILKLLKDFK